MTETVWRDAILTEACDWLGTPYRHQASVKDEGADCLGYLRGVWRALYGAEPETPPAYTPDWAERGGEETLKRAADRHLTEVSLASARPGDVLLFRIARHAPAKHCAILSHGGLEDGRILHAYWGRAVTETWLTPWWRRRAAFAYAFPHPKGN